ncbi:MAG: hypothetical protein A2017_21860 [Lentisphaerae bacterium GWF2_44_16]|nr:MAG: hypothetical protein A2017_21860 [Lentisphaerae bacterium GWF2_44_16]
MLGLKKMFCAGFIMMGASAVFSDCFIKETEGKYLLGNEYIKVTVEPEKGGSISEFEFCPLDINFSQAEGNSLVDEFYAQYKKDGKTNIYTEAIDKRKFIPEIIKNTAEEIQLKLSASGGSTEFEWLTFSKTYSLKKNSSALKIDYICQNNTDQAHQLGIRTKAFLRKKGFFPEKNIFITPTCNGILEIEQPGANATPGGDYHMEPAAGWEAVVGAQDGSGILIIVDDKLISCFFNWYRDSGFSSTTEWFLREQVIAGNGSFTASVTLLPIEGMKRIDGIAKGNIACGISPDGKVYLISPEKIYLDVRIGTEETKKAELLPSKLIVMDFTPLKNGVIEVSIYKGKELLGKIERNSDGKEIVRKEPQRTGVKAVAPIYYKYYRGAEAEGIVLRKLASVEKSGSSGKNGIEKTVLRQFEDSLAEAYLSPEMMPMAEKGVCLYEMDKSGRTEVEVISCLKKEKDGSGILFWEVKGLGGRPLDAKEKDGELYDKTGKSLGRIEQKYSIAFGRKSKKTDTLNEKANMLANASFEDEYFDFYKRSKELVSQDDKTFQSGKKSLKITKKPKDNYTSVPFWGIVEGNRNYDISAWCRQDTTGKALVTMPVYFYDKDWVQIKDLKGNVWKKYAMQQEGSFEWRKFGGIIKSPENARFIQISVTGRPEEGGALWIDDINIKSQLIKASNDMEEELAKIKSSTYKAIDEIFAVSEDFITPHEKWLKPKSGKKTEILWLTSLKYAADIRKRELVEMAQRMSMDYKFIPLLPKMLTPSRGFQGMNGGDTYGTALEPYIIMLLQKELSEKKYDVIVVQDLSFTGSAQACGQRSEIEASKKIETVQKEFTDMLLNAAKEGAGLVFYNCKDIPAEFQKIQKENKVKTPEGILIMPQIRKVADSRLKSICTTANCGKGRIAILDANQSLYPCIPANRVNEITGICYDYNIRSFPYMEYKLAPFIKAIRWASWENAKAVIEKLSFDNGKLNFTISAEEDGDYTIVLDYKDIYWHDEGIRKEKVSLRKGINELKIETLANLPGGKNVVNCRLMDNSGKICDFGSATFELHEECKVQSVEFNNKDRIYRLGEDVKARIELEGDWKGAEIVCEVEDSNNRIVNLITMPAQKSADISFKLKGPYTILYHLFLKIRKGEKILSQNMVDFSHPFAYPPTDDLTAYIWGGGTPRLLVLKDVGFDADIIGFNNIAEQHLRALCNMNIRPVSVGCGSILGIGSRSQYKSDMPTKDPVRHPCLSDPEHWKKARPFIHEKVKGGNHLYYGIRDYFTNDEFSLGASVCISEYCLHDFREYLKKQYSSIAELNKVWKSSFKDWQKIVPLPMKDVSVEKDNIAAWLEHRLFMNNVYAYTWLGKTKEYLKEVNPEAKLGPSGTLNPGFSMDWYKTMQKTDFLANYGGMQTNLIASFANPDTVFGRWTGGYVPSNEPYERYVRSILWEGLFFHNNAYMYFHGGVGTTMRGDLQMTCNMKYCAEELKEVKAGIAKLILSSKKADVRIAVLYSQASMFTAIATIGKEYWDGAMDSWKNLLDDLKYNFCFISSEQLAERGIDMAQYKVLVLPCTLSLSRKETEKIKDFVRNGGTLITDFATGLFDEHGTKSANRELYSVLGLERTGYELDIIPCEEKISEEKSLNISAGKYMTRFAEKDLKLTTGKALGNTGNPSTPSLILNNTGKGKSIFMNNLINGYSLITLKGAGGELSEELKGPELVREMTRNIVGQLLNASGLTPLFSVKTPDGKIYPSMGVVFEDGKNKYLGILKSASGAGVINREKEAVDVTISFPEKAHIYDIRKGEYLGYASEIKTSIIPAIAKLYALLPHKVAGIKLDGINKEYKRGASIEADVKVQVSSENAGDHVIHFEAVSPDGTTVKCYSQNIKLKNGEGKVTLNTALNDMLGKWTFRIGDIASGIVRNASFTLK